MELKCRYLYSISIKLDYITKFIAASLQVIRKTMHENVSWQDKRKIKKLYKTTFT